MSDNKNEKQKNMRFTPGTFPKAGSDIAKGIAILFMLFYHLFSTPSSNLSMSVNYAPLPESVFLLIAKYGNICVSVFVFLTAYGISRKLQLQNADTLKECYKDSLRRGGKLFFHFVFMFLVCNLIWFRYFDYASYYGPGKQGVLSFLTDALGLAQFFNTPTLNLTWWYMALAYTLVFIVPMLFLLCRKIGKAFPAVAFLLPFLLPVGNDLTRYFFVMALGIFCAEENIIETILKSKIPHGVRIPIWILLFAFSVPARENAFVQDHLLYLADAVFAFIIVMIAADIISCIPVVRTVFAFLGRHSMNIFFVHTFFYLILYREYVYYFRYAAVTFLILLGLSLMLSLVIEGLKQPVYLINRKIAKKRNEKTRS